MGFAGMITRTLLGSGFFLARAMVLRQFAADRVSLDEARARFAHPRNRGRYRLVAARWAVQKARDPGYHRNSDSRDPVDMNITFDQ